MNKTLKISFSLGSTTAINLFAGIVKTKIWAVYLGPSGVGLISQIYNYQLFLSLLSSFGLAQGITKYVSEYRKNDDMGNANSVLNIANSISMFISFIFVGLTVILAPIVSSVVLGDKTLFLLIIVAVLGVPFQSIGENCLAYLQGCQGVRQIVRSNLLIAIAGLFSAVILIIFFNINGAVIHLILLGIITYLAFCWYSIGLSSPLGLIAIRNIKETLRSVLLKKLVNFGFLRLVQIALGSLTILIVRSLVIHYQGAFQNGIYQAASNFSVFFIPLILNMLWSYFYADFCSAKTKTELTYEVNRFFHYSLLVSLPAIILILLLRQPLIHLIYAPTFESVIQILPLQLLGDFVRVMCMPLGGAMLSREMLLAGVVYEFIWNIVFITAAFFLLPSFNLTVLLMAYILSYLLNFIMYYIHIAYFTNFKLTARNLSITILSILLILVTGFLPLTKFSNMLMFGVLAISWLLISLPWLVLSKSFVFIRGRG